MLSFRDNKILFDQKRCCQCGVCLASCEYGALKRIWLDNGLFRIESDAEKCTKCLKCLKTCPAPMLPDILVTEKDWQAIQQVYLGNSVDDNVRYAASSGGVARALLHGALKTDLCQAAYAVLEADAYPWATGGYFTGESNDTRIANSKYLPVPMCENLLPRESGTLIVAGTNCQLLAVDAFYKNSDVKLIKIGLLCKQQKTLDFSRFIAKRLGINNYGNTAIRYRGEGWPGTMTIQEKKMLWEKAAALPFGKRLWSVPGCRFCNHPLGSVADITLADPWKIVDSERKGMTMILVRSLTGKQLLDKCHGIIELRSIAPEKAKQSVDWQGMHLERERTDFYCGHPLSNAKRLKFKIGELQRSMYEALLISIRFPEPIYKILNHLPYWG